MTVIPCDNSYSQAETMLGQINAFFNSVDFEADSICMNTYPFGYGIAINLSPNSPTTSFSAIRRDLSTLEIGHPCVLPLFCTSSNSFTFFPNLPNSSLHRNT